MTNSTHPRQARSSHSIQDCQPHTNLSSAFWRSAPVTFLSQSAFGKPLPGPVTEVRSRWSSNHLYLLFTCPFDRLHLKSNPNTLTETNKLWEWDVAEVFLGSDFNNIRRYKEFELTPQGSTSTWTLTALTPRTAGFGVQNSKWPRASFTRTAFGTVRCAFLSPQSTRARHAPAICCEPTSSEVMIKGRA